MCHLPQKTKVINQIFIFLLHYQIPHRSSADETAEAHRESALVPTFHGPLEELSGYMDFKATAMWLWLLHDSTGDDQQTGRLRFVI